jgi:hypothetical protein
MDRSVKLNPDKGVLKKPGPKVPIERVRKYLLAGPKVPICVP